MNSKIDFDSEDRAKLINKVSYTSIVVNVLLFIFKLFAGVFAQSAAMVSDAIHSLSDILSTIVVIVGAHLSKKEHDESHNYGHEKFESIAGMLLAVILALTAIWIFNAGIQSLVLASHGELARPGMLALVAAIVSIVTKEWMYHFTVRAAEKVKSTALKADAWHHRSDAFSSIGSMVGVIGSMLGFTFFDPLASMVIGVLIIKVAIDILRESIDQVTDRAVNKEFSDTLYTAIIDVEGVECIDLLKTRVHGNRVYVDVEIAVCKTLTIENAHYIAEAVHDKIEDSFSDIKHCMVHVNPHL